MAVFRVSWRYLREDFGEVETKNAKEAIAKYKDGIDYQTQVIKGYKYKTKRIK